MIFMAFLLPLVVPGGWEIRSCSPSIPCRSEVEVCDVYPRMSSGIFTVVSHLLKKHSFPTLAVSSWEL